MLKRYDFESLLQRSATSDKIRVIPFGTLFESPKKNEEPEKKFTDLDIENAKKEAYQTGFSAGLNEGQNMGRGEKMAVEQNLDASLKIISGKIAEIFAKIDADKEELTKTFTKLSYDIAKKIAGAALKNNPTAEIENAVKETLNLLGHEAKIIINVNPEQKTEIEAKITALVQALEHAGKVQIKADEQIKANDGRIEWEGGSLALNNQKVIESITAILDKFGGKDTQ